MTFTNKKSLIALIITLCMVVSLFTVAVFADDTTAAAADSVVEAVTGESNTASAVEDNSEAATTEKVAENATEEATKDTTTTGETEDTVDVEAILAEQAKAKKILIINAIIIAAIIAIIVVVAIKFRAKLSVFFRSVKSELGKIVWSSKENTRKSFLVVIVVALAIAAIIWVLDLTFNTGIGMLGKLFG